MSSVYSTPESGNNYSDWVGRIGFKISTGGTRGVPPSFNFNESPQSENITTEKAKASKITQDFVQSTMPQINSFSKRSSCLWLTAYLVFITVLIGQTAAMLLDFCSHPVNVQVTLETEPRFLDFPAITLCNNNAIKKIRIERMSRFKELAILDDVIFQNVLPEENRDRSVYASYGMFPCYGESFDYWIPPSRICDGKHDCLDGSDENPFHCQVFHAVDYNETCLDGYLRCPNESICALQCDGVAECEAEAGFDESDELGCQAGDGTIILEATEQPASISSPNHPATYQNNLDILFLIQAPENYVIKIIIDNINIEDCGVVCACDYLSFSDGSDSTTKQFTFNGSKKLCGIGCDFDVIVSSYNQVSVNFTTDSSVVRAGWTFSYQAVLKTSFVTRPQYDIWYSTNCDERPTTTPIPFPEYGGLSTGPPPDFGIYEAVPFSIPGFDSFPQETTTRPVFPQPEEREETRNPNTDYEYYYLDIGEIPKYDWFFLHEISTAPDFSDFRMFAQFTEEEFAGNGHRKENFIVQCLFNRQPCDAGSFHTFRHFLNGNCFTFNSIMRQNDERAAADESIRPLHVKTDGPNSGLVVTLFLENDEYVGVLGQSSGARLVVHNFEEYPSVDRKSIQVNAGTETIIKLKQQVVVRESDPFSGCAEEWPDFLELSPEYRKYEYSLEFCEYLCVQRALAQECGCSDSFDWNFSKNPDIRNAAKVDCDPWNMADLLCSARVRQEFQWGFKKCDCPNSCYSKTFSKEISSVSWPSEAFTSHFVSLMQRSNSSAVRKFINTLLSNRERSSKTELNEKMRKNFARIYVSFETLLYTKIEESPKYTLSMLFGSMGGNLGLWLGWSLLSFLELFQWLFNLSSILIINLKKRWHRKIKPQEKTEEQMKNPYL